MVQQTNLGSSLWWLWAPRKATGQPLCVTFANAPFPEQIINDSLESMCEYYHGAPIEGREKFVAIFAVNYMVSPLKTEGKLEGLQILSWARNA